MNFFFLIASLFLTTELLVAQSIPARPPKYTPVNDYTNTLTAAEIQSISKKLIDFEAQQSTQIVIVMVGSLGSRTVEQYANELYRAWGIGQKGKDNGVLVLVAKNDRKMRIETGYGAEGAITDLAAQQIITDILRPNFKNNAYGKGLSEAADKLMSLIMNEYSNADRANSPVDQKVIATPIIFVIFIAILILYVLYRAGNATRSGTIYSSGGAVYSSGGVYQPTYSSGSWWSGGSSSSSSDYSSSSSSDSSSSSSSSSSSDYSSSSSSDSPWSSSSSSSDSPWSSSSSSSDSSWSSSSSSSDWGGGDSGGGGSSGDW